ncbi:hypothetical protein HELRODRAFT_177770 [Helobdella robusta]|uniref:Uncharacterized protein n=1 Tax=Helobdella robusta TaxID=6412 RepID=T1FC83_HELRO|nr:hypothetical protein HELRODRAFT_177770 [Helobdella robusta]ESN97711.1 hypothetical protein HELRODRAFT_177770 [Helobdella robusta]
MPPASCRTKCRVSQDSCGGSKFYSVYAKAVFNQSYVGCFKIVEMDYKGYRVSLDDCLDSCRKKGYSLYSSRVVPTGATECRCGNKFILASQAYKDQCTIEEYNYSVVKTIYSEVDLYEDLKTFKYCLNDYQSSGETYCSKSQTCIQGWMGEFCNFRNCKVRNGQCKGNTICVVSLVNKMNHSACLCPDGMVRSKAYNCVVSTTGENFPMRLASMVVGIIFAFLMLSLGVIFLIARKYLKPKEIQVGDVSNELSAKTSPV